jgi:hypothetical protein
MPNRGELPIPAMRGKSATKSAAKSGAALPDSEAWTIIAFCVIGWLMSFYVAVSSVGVDAFPGLMAQVPWG